MVNSPHGHVNDHPSKPAVRSFHLAHWRKRDLVGIGMLAVFLCGAGALFFLYHQGQERLAFYQNTHVGDDVGVHLKRADGVVQIAGKRVFYFFGRGPFSHRAELPDRVNSFRDLPWLFDAMQFLVDENNILHAKGWCGETGHIETRHGNMKGSSLDLLEQDGEKTPAVEAPVPANAK